MTRTEMTPEEARQLCNERLYVPLWPVAGKALGLGRWSSYDKARRGEIVTTGIGHRKNVPTTWLRQKLGI